MLYRNQELTYAEPSIHRRRHRETHRSENPLPMRHPISLVIRKQQIQHYLRASKN